MEAKESPEESAAREVLEETGLVVEITRLPGACSPGKGVNVVALFYLGLVRGGKLSPGDDASAAGVFQHDSLPVNIAFELHRNMINLFFTSAGNLERSFPLGFEVLKKAKSDFEKTTSISM